jgi:hypothetical protein
MSKIEEQLRLIREGHIIEASTSDTSEPTQEMLEAVYELFMAESAMIKTSLNESSGENMSFVELMQEAAAVAVGDQEKSMGVFTKIKQKLKAIQARFDPYEGLKELQLANQVKTDTQDMRKMNFWWGITGVIISSYRQAAKYKAMPKDLIQKYNKEAAIFKANLHKQVDALDPVADKAKIKILTRQITKLNMAITDFEQRSTGKS